MEKQLYKGVFNWHGEVITRYTYAIDKNKAKAQFIIQLTQQLNRTPQSLRRYYSGGKANYEIEKG